MQAESDPSTDNPRPGLIHRCCFIKEDLSNRYSLQTTHDLLGSMLVFVATVWLLLSSSSRVGCALVVFIQLIPRYGASQLGR
jgi:hypothetical protein